MKSSQTGLPRSFERSIVPPPSLATTSGGAGWPRWNWAASGSVDDGDGIPADDPTDDPPGEAPFDDGGATDGDAGAVDAGGALGGAGLGAELDARGTG